MLKFIDERKWSTLVFVLCCALCFANVWGYPISILDEAKNTEAAREMFFGNHFLPTFNGFLRTDKPPLHYFFMQISYTVFGINPFGARIFSALAGGFLGLVFFRYTARFTSKDMGLFSTFILYSSFFWLNEFHLAVPDPYLILFLSIAWLSFYDFTKHKKKSALFIFYSMIGLATLTKGPVAIGLSGLVALLFIIYKREISLKKIIKYRPFLGGLWVLIIAAPWFIWIHYATEGAFTQGFFVEHNLRRFSTTMEGHGGTFIVTLAFVFLGLFPFSLFLPQAIYHVYKFYKKNEFIAFCGIVSGVVIGFFCLSGTRLPNYTLPAMPFLAIIIAHFFEEYISLKSYKKWGIILSSSIISLVTLAIPVAVFILFKGKELSVYKWTFGILLLVLSGSYIYLIFNYLNKNNLPKFIYTIGAGWMLFSMIIFYFIFPQLWGMSPFVSAQKKIEPTSPIVVYKNYDPAFNINFKKTFKVYHDLDKLKNQLKKDPNTYGLTRNRNISTHSLEKKGFSIILQEQTVFEGYKTIIFKIKEK